MQGVGLLVLRLTLGLTLVLHGLPKLVPMWGMGPRETEALFVAAGVTPAYAIAVGYGLVQLLSGLLLFAGAYTLWTSILLVTTISTVAWKLHVPHGFFINWAMEPGVGHGVEQSFLIVGGVVCLMLAGPGPFSIDRRRARAAEARKLSRTVARAAKK
jgi:putative oxidoreductase